MYAGSGGQTSQIPGRMPDRQEPVKASPPETAQVLTAMCSSLDRLEVTVNDLAGRLAPILRVSTPQNGDSLGAAKDFSSPIAESIAQNCHRIDGIKCALEELLSRVEV
jgi:hypothetical protein